jgi:hypothetical protein
MSILCQLRHLPENRERHQSGGMPRDGSASAISRRIQHPVARQRRCKPDSDLRGEPASTISRRIQHPLRDSFALTPTRSCSPRPGRYVRARRLCTLPSLPEAAAATTAAAHMQKPPAHQSAVTNWPPPLCACE